MPQKSSKSSVKSTTKQSDSQKKTEKTTRLSEVETKIHDSFSEEQDLDELHEEQNEENLHHAASGGSTAAALAATSTEISGSFKNFRHHPDMENFYRFIYENDLRYEALAIIDQMAAEKAQRKIVKGSKTQPH